MNSDGTIESERRTEQAPTCKIKKKLSGAKDSWHFLVCGPQWVALGLCVGGTWLVGTRCADGYWAIQCGFDRVWASWGDLTFDSEGLDWAWEDHFETRLWNLELLYFFRWEPQDSREGRPEVNDALEWSQGQLWRWWQWVKSLQQSSRADQSQ